MGEPHSIRLFVLSTVNGAHSVCACVYSGVCQGQGQKAWHWTHKSKTLRPPSVRYHRNVQPMGSFKCMAFIKYELIIKFGILKQTEFYAKLMSSYENCIYLSSLPSSTTTPFSSQSQMWELLRFNVINVRTHARNEVRIIAAKGFCVSLCDTFENGIAWKAMAWSTFTFVIDNRIDYAFFSLCFCLFSF